MFLLPSRVLENLTCDFCHKFLSVGPVKVYPGGKTKCGRCPRDGEDTGAVSQYAKIAQFGVFKCVNRFDGCDKLLSYHEVSDHESKCHSKAFVCPLCPQTRNIPTFFLIKHFEDEHGEHLLRKSSFEVGLMREQRTETYLHRVEDSLFFIECRNNSSETLELRSLLLGDPNKAREITQQFTVRFDNLVNKVVTQRRCCATFGSDDSTSFKISKQSYQWALVEFQVDTLGVVKPVKLPTGLSEGNSNPQVQSQPDTLGFVKPAQLPTGLINEGNSNPQVDIQQDTFEVVKPVQPTTSLGEENPNPPDPERIFQPRKLALSLKFQKKHPDFSISSTSTSIKKGETTEILPWCYNCSLVLAAGETYIQLDAGTYQWLCWRCEEYCRRDNPDLQYVDHEEITPVSLHIDLSFFCAWGCGNFFSRLAILDHERGCEKQPKQPCPVHDCRFRGEVTRFLKHFSESHPTFRNKSRSFLKLVRPAGAPSTQRGYLWMGSCFVLLEIDWGKTGCEVEIHGPPGVSEGARPVGLLFLQRYSPCFATVTVGKTCKVKRSEFFMKVFLKK